MGQSKTWSRVEASEGKLCPSNAPGSGQLRGVSFPPTPRTAGSWRPNAGLTFCQHLLEVLPPLLALLHLLARRAEPGPEGCQIVLDAPEEARGSYTVASENRFTPVCALSTSPAPFGLLEPRGYSHKFKLLGMEEGAGGERRSGLPGIHRPQHRRRSCGQCKLLFPVWSDIC